MAALIAVVVNMMVVMVGIMVCSHGDMTMMVVIVMTLLREGWPKASTKESVCVLHIESLFLPVDMQQTPCRCLSYILDRCELCGGKRRDRDNTWRLRKLVNAIPCVQDAKSRPYVNQTHCNRETKQEDLKKEIDESSTRQFNT